MLIGITGTHGAGKGVVSEFLKKKGFTVRVMSDFLREEAKRQKIEETRENLLSIGNELRAGFGDGIIVEKLCELQTKEFGNDGNLVIDGLRSLGEVEALKKQGGILIGIDAPVHLRYQRIAERKSSKDFITFEQFQAGEIKENELKGCLELADFVIINDTYMEKVCEEVGRFLHL